jgi:hypothetical protein
MEMNMKKLLASAAFVAMAFMSTGAMAQANATFNVTAEAEVGLFCSSATAGDKTVELTNFVDANGKVVTTEQDFTLGDVTCNGAANVGVQSQKGGLENVSGSCGSGASSTCVLYTATAKQNNTGVVSLPTTGTAGEKANTVDPISADGTYSLGIAPTTNANVLAEGTFSDLITVQVGGAL